MGLLTWSLFKDVNTAELAGWAVVLSGLAVVGVVWIARGLRKLAINQVKLGVMLEELLKKGK